METFTVPISHQERQLKGKVNKTKQNSQKRKLNSKVRSNITGELSSIRPNIMFKGGMQ